VALSSVEAYEKHAAELVRFATGLVGPDDAPDVVSEAFVKAIRSNTWNGIEHPRAYLYQVVTNEVRMRHRATMRRRARERKAAVDPVTYETDVRPEVLEAVGRLSPRQRAVIVLTYWEDLTPSAVAERLAISDGAVRRHLARARARLQEVLDV
jgi:RNA polymerase sigma factor (sigma-70 family)